MCLLALNRLVSLQAHTRPSVQAELDLRTSRSSSIGPVQTVRHTRTKSHKLMFPGHGALSLCILIYICGNCLHTSGDQSHPLFRGGRGRDRLTGVTWFEIVGAEREAASSVSTFVACRTHPGLTGTRASRVAAQQRKSPRSDGCFWNLMVVP